MLQAPMTAPPCSAVIRNTASPAVLFAPEMKPSASAVRYGCGMRAVFSAMRRSLASAATVLASSRRGARRASRLVSRTGILASRKLSQGISSSRVMALGLQFRDRAGLPGRRKAKRGSRSPVSPSRSFQEPRRFDLGDRRTSILSYRLLGRCLSHRNNRYEFAAFFFRSELNLPVDKREQRVILAHADITAGMPGGTALTGDDVAGKTNLAAGLLQAEATAVGVAAVPGRSACFFVSHNYSLEFERVLHRFPEGIISHLCFSRYRQ